MKKKYTIIALASVGIIGAGQLSAQEPGKPPVPPVPPAPVETPKLTEKEAFTIGSYVLGYQQGRGMHGAGFKETEFSKEELMKGLAKGLKGEEADIPEEKMRAAMQMLQELAQKRNEEKEKAKHAEKIAKNKEFLEKNGKREGVKTTASGLQYEVLKKGGDRKYVAPAGGAPDMGTRFMVHYKGSLINGEEFDSSAKHSPDGKPAEFTLQVVPGFSEALKTMSVGSKWKIFLPAELGYGSSPRGPGGPYSALIFEVELVDIKSAPEPAPAPPTGQAVPVPAPPAPPIPSEKE